MASSVRQLQELYVAYFNRPADSAGLKYWTKVLEATPDGLAVVSSAFAASSEYRASFAGKTSSEAVGAVYQNLFGRAAEPAGVHYWSTLLDNGTIKIDAVVTAIAKGALTTDLYTYESRVIVATAITTAVDTLDENLAFVMRDTNPLVRAYLAKVVDESSFNAAMDAQAINQLVASLIPIVTLTGLQTQDHVAAGTMFS